MFVFDKCLCRSPILKLALPWVFFTKQCIGSSFGFSNNYQVSVNDYYIFNKINNEDNLLCGTTGNQKIIA